MQTLKGLVCCVQLRAGNIVYYQTQMFIFCLIKVQSWIECYLQNCNTVLTMGCCQRMGVVAASPEKN